MSTDPRQILHGSDSNEWFTPGHVIELARKTMGAIDLDPASCAEANKVVKAARYFTEADDGLTSRWGGRVWLNPPYGRGANHESNQAIWTRRAIHAYRSGEMQAACVLVNAMPGNRWFQPLWDFPICFVRGRLKFWRPGDEANSPTHSNVVVYLGHDAERFDVVFQALGNVVLPRCLRARQASLALELPE